MADAETNVLNRVLLVEDEPLEAEILVTILENGGYQVVCQHEPQAAIRMLETNPFDYVISDYMMPGMNGLQVLRRARHYQPDSVRMLITGKGDFDMALEAINRGEVYRFLPKPVDARELIVSLRLAGERMSMAKEVEHLKAELRKRDAALRELQEKGE